jgi:hypothetical protein
MRKRYALQDLEEIIGFLAHMDEGLTNTSLTLHLLIDDYRLISASNEGHINALWMWMETLVSLLGTRPPTLGSEFETPVWAAVGKMASMMELVLGKIGNHKPDELITQAKTSMEAMFVEKLSLLRVQLNHSLGTFRGTFVITSRALPVG